MKKICFCSLFLSLPCMLLLYSLFNSLFFLTSISTVPRTQYSQMDYYHCLFGCILILIIFFLRNFNIYFHSFLHHAGAILSNKFPCTSLWVIDFRPFFSVSTNITKHNKKKQFETEENNNNMDGPGSWVLHSYVYDARSLCVHVNFNCVLIFWMSDAVTHIMHTSIQK